MRPAVIVVLVALLAGLCWPLPWLTLGVLQTDNSVALRWAFPGGEGTGFALRWQHSVEREDWIEYFRLVPGGTRLVATRFRTFGAGVPDSIGSATRIDNGWVVMAGIDRRVDPLLVQAASQEHYRLLYAGRRFDMASLGSAPILRIQQQRRPLLWAASALWRPWWHWIQRGQLPPKVEKGIMTW